MIEEEARHILHMIRKRDRFRSMVNTWKHTLERIRFDIDSLSNLQSPQGNSEGVRSQNPIGLATQLNSLLTDEMEAEASYIKAVGLLNDSTRYHRELMESVGASDREFIIDFLSDKRKADVGADHGYADAHKRMITIIRNSGIRL